MAVKRLTNLFFAELSEEPIRVDFIVDGSIRGTPTVKDGIVATTNFPFILDEDLALYRSARNSDGTIGEDGGLFLDPDIISSNGVYNDRDWFLGLSVNDQLVWNGIPRPTTVQREPGVEYGYIYIDDRIAISKAEFINNGSGARIEIDTELSNLGTLDVVEIAIIKANIWTPWIYYGNIPARQKISYDIFNRSSSSMGGIPESLTPSQAVGYRYYVDFSLSAEFDPILVPFPSAFISPTFSGGFASNKQFFMGDILNGNGEVAARSACSFDILSISLGAGVGLAQTQVLNIINTGAFRTINYKPIEYEKKTYDNNKIIKNTTFYLAFKDDSNFADTYANLSEAIRVFIGAQIDFETCKFRTYIYGSGTSFSWGGVSESADSLADAILGIAESAASGSTGDNAPISNLFSIVKAEATLDYSQDLLGFIAEDEANNPNAFSRKYSFVAFGDLNFESGDSILGKENIDTSIDGVIYSKKILTSGGQIIFESGAEVFGSASVGPSINQIFGYRDSSVYSFQFLETLGLSIGLILSEDSLYNGFEYFNSPVVKSQCNRITSSRTPTSSVNFNFDAQDVDGDGKISLLDRIYDLYSGFNPSIDDVEESFFGSRSMEMRYWRKVCPIGRIFEFNGQIESVVKQRGNNYLCKVKILVLDPETNTYVDSSLEDNTVWVYYEDGATTNVGGAGIGDTFNFRGRLFFPKYFVNGGAGISLGTGINLIDATELTAWYRIGINTSRDLIDYGFSGHDLEEDPIIVIRSNILGGVDSDIYPHASGISQNPFNFLEEQQFFSISQSSERVQDHVLSLDVSQEEDDIVFGKPPLVSSYNIFSSDKAINFQSIEFQVEVDRPEEGESAENNGLYTFDIEYKPINNNNFYPMAKFWSAAAFSSGGNISDVKIDLSTPQLYGTELANSLGNDQVYAIVFPYNLHSQANGGVFHFFEFLPEYWSVRVIKNGKEISSIVKDDLSLDEFSFEGNEAKVTSSGYVVLKTPLDRVRESVFVEFTNIAGDQKMLKTGTDIKISLRTYYPQAEGQVKIRNIRINTGETKSVERVDVHYSNRNESGTHFIAPALGFAVLSDRGWNLNQDDANNTAGGSFSTRVTGFLESPQLYFDAFSDNIGEKTITAFNSRDIPAIDIIYSNMVSVSTQPYMELFSIGYTLPPVDTLPKSAAYIDEDTGRFTIYYSKNDRIIKKESINYFFPKSYIKGYRDNTRWEYAVYGGYDDDIRELPFTHDNNFEEFSVSLSGQRGQLVGVRLTTTDVGDRNNFNDIVYFDVFSNGFPFGYERYDGKRSSLVIPVRTHSSGFSGGYSMLPDTSGISSIEFRLGEKSPFFATIDKVEGFFVNEYTQGNAPNLTVNSQGLYMLFFENQEKRQVLGMISDSHSYRWKRPAISDTERERFGTPIALLSGYTNPVLVDDVGDRNLYIFVYNDDGASISLIVVPYSTFKKLSIGAGEESEDLRRDYEQQVDPDNPFSITALTKDPNTKEWFKVYDFGRKLLPITQGATRDFSAAQVKSGRIYMAYRTLDNQVKILFTTNTSYNELKKENSWTDVGVDLLSEDSRLGRVLKEFGGIYSMTLSSPLDEDKLYLLIATNNSKLLFFDLPEAIAKISADLEKVETPLRAALQRAINDIKPSLVIGTDSGEPNDDLVKSDFLNKDFTKQIVSLVWNKKREGFLIFLDNGKVRALKTTSRGLTWGDYEEV